MTTEKTGTDTTQNAIVSFETSSKNSSTSTAKVEGLKDLYSLLEGLIASVKVSNPMAREKPHLAVQEMVKICSKFDRKVVEAVVDDIKFGGDAVWPTAGVMNAKLRDRQIQAQQASRPAEQSKTRPMTTREILNTTAGKEACGRHVAARFVQHVKAGRLEITPSLPVWWVEKAEGARRERREIADQLGNPDSEWFVEDEGLRQILGVLSAKLDQHEIDFSQKHFKS